MDTRLQEALDFSNYRLTLSTQIENLKIKLASDLLVTHANGIFTASMERINTVDRIRTAYVDFPVIDDNGIPIHIPNLNEFYTLLFNTYTSAMLSYSSEYRKLAQARNIKKIVDYNE
jgi:hypothetical protein